MPTVNVSEIYIIYDIKNPNACNKCGSTHNRQALSLETSRYNESMFMSLTLIAKAPVASNVWLFTFEPSTPIVWIAGQFIRVELPHNHPDSEGTKRQFTIASAPADGHIQIATRITGSSFKQALQALPIGGRLNLVDLPAGDFTWPRDDSHPIVLAAQGIGITPVRSMIRQHLSEGRPIPATLVYSNLVPGIPFQDELSRWTARKEFRVHMTTHPLTGKVLSDLVPNLASARVYVSGPDSLIELVGPPVNLPISSLKQDQFPNYARVNY